MLAALLVMVSASMARAESSATAYDAKYYSQQVFVMAYNNFNVSINRDNVVIIDAAAAINPNVNLGSYIIPTGTTDSIFVFGVTDEAIAAGTMGRVCIRGPHKAVGIVGAGFPTSGAIISSSNVMGKFGYGNSTADGTAVGRLGYVLSATATTDTGDASGTYWVWVNPSAHK